MAKGIVVLGSFVADLAFRVTRLPTWGETLMAQSFTLGPGGKGSNQAVAAARCGAEVRMLSRVGADPFGQMARELWQAEGIDATLTEDSPHPTGAAAILLNGESGENAIAVAPGACFTLSPEDVNTHRDAIAGASLLLTQLELPLAVVHRGLALARQAGAVTVLNPAPAPPGGLPRELLELADWLVPNESEAELLTGLPVTGFDEAAAAAERLQGMGAGNVIVTLGARGSLLCTADTTVRIAPVSAGPTVDTTGAGDAFCGAFAAALVSGQQPVAAANFASSAAGIAVTRPGTAPAMPHLAEVQQLMRRSQS